MTAQSLAERAALVLRNSTEGERWIPWAALTRLEPAEVARFQAALIEAQAADPRLEVKVLTCTSIARGFDGIVVKWRTR